MRLFFPISKPKYIVQTARFASSSLQTDYHDRAKCQADCPSQLCWMTSSVGRSPMAPGMALFHCLLEAGAQRPAQLFANHRDPAKSFQCLSRHPMKPGFNGKHFAAP